MPGRTLFLAQFLLLIFILTVSADDGTITMTTIGSGHSVYGGSSDSLGMYKDYYNFGQETQPIAGAVQFDIRGAEPSYLIINGQSRPYDPYDVPSNSLWIQGRTSWTQYIECPLNARIMMLAVSSGGPSTMTEKYASGRQDVNYYDFYPGYTQLVFVANEVGRHVLTFYSNGQQSNPITVDVVSYGGSYVPGYTLPAGQPYSSSVKISIGVTGKGSSETGRSNQPISGRGCSILGTWNFGTNGPYNIVSADGTLVAKDDLGGDIFDRGIWRVIDASRRRYGFTWQSGWAHTFTLSADCSTLDGFGRLNGGAEEPGHATRVTSGVDSGYSAPSGLLIDSADQGFDPNARIGGYDETSTQPGRILVDSTANGFNPTQGEAI